MTLEELDEALVKLHLNLNSNAGQEARNRILERYGRTILDARSERCANCWQKEHGKCTPNCRLYMHTTDPVEVAKSYLSQPNDVNLFPFVCIYVIPLYEETTGETGTMEKLMKDFKRRWKAEGRESPLSSEKIMKI